MVGSDKEEDKLTWMRFWKQRDHAQEYARICKRRISLESAQNANKQKRGIERVMSIDLNKEYTENR